MKRRPLSVTIVAWFLIITSVFSVFSMWNAYNNPVARRIMSASALAVDVQIAIGVINLIVALVCGIGILKGRNWARWVYTGWGVAGLIVGLATSPFKSMILLSAVMLAAFAFFLFRRPANEWFAASSEAAPA